ncbi:MAG TPA: DUF3107 domain-containing protein [Acidimicrobiia bacterium]|nr:DUF3107 domain-containing protein [Acidimicrobiia bacterium]
MEIRIGVVYSPKELVIELDEGKAGEKAASDAVKALEQAADDGGKLVWLTDNKGRRVGIPTDKLAYVEISSADEDAHVGFGR